MKTIELTKGQVALVSDKDYHHLNEWNWFAQLTNAGYYAARWDYTGPKRKRIYMHRYILGLQQGNKLQGDHKDGNKLNNQRSNLRIVTNQQNQFNLKARNQTGQLGVYCKPSGRYIVQLRVGGKNHYLGTYDTIKQAAAAREEGFLRLFGPLPK